VTREGGQNFRIAIEIKRTEKTNKQHESKEMTNLSVSCVMGITHLRWVVRYTAMRHVPSRKKAWVGYETVGCRWAIG